MFLPKCLLSWIAALAIPVVVYNAPVSAQAYTQAPGPEATIDGHSVPVETYQIGVVRGRLQGGLIYANQLTLTVPPISPQGEDVLESEVGQALSELKLTTYAYSDVPNVLIKTVQTFKRSSERAASFKDGNGILTFWFEDFTSTTTQLTCDSRWNGQCTAAGS